MSGLLIDNSVWSPLPTSTPVAPALRALVNATPADQLLICPGLLRTAGPTDTVTAAYAIANDATVIHYDRDFENIAAAARTLKHCWRVPSGTA